MRGWISRKSVCADGAGWSSSERTLLRGCVGTYFGHVHSAVSGAYVVVMNTIVVVCLGMFFAAQPAAYREGALLLLPVPIRPRVRDSGALSLFATPLRRRFYYLPGQIALAPARHHYNNSPTRLQALPRA